MYELKGRLPLFAKAAQGLRLPEDFHFVLRNPSIGRKDGQSLHLSLRYKHPIERIPMMVRKGIHMKRVSQLDRQNLDAVLTQLANEKPFHRGG